MPILADEGFTDEMILRSLPAMRKYALILTHNDADAADLVQDTCERLITKRKHFTLLGDNFVSWVIKVMTNVFYDVTRKRQGRREAKRVFEDISSEELKHETILEQPPNQEAVVMAVETLNALDRLSYIDNRIIVAHAVGYEPMEIAEQENMNYKHTSKRIWLARQRLIKALGE